MAKDLKPLQKIRFSHRAYGSGKPVKAKGYENTQPRKIMNKPLEKPSIDRIIEIRRTYKAKQFHIKDLLS